MSNLTDFFPSGGGGGLTPKFQEFNASGTFTPSQALIDAGGYIEIFLVGGGSNTSYSAKNGGGGAEVLTKAMYLTSTTPVSVTIGSGAVQNANGGNSIFSGESAGGVTVTSIGGTTSRNFNGRIGAGWPGNVEFYFTLSAGTGVLGYGLGAGGASSGGPTSPKANSGSGGNGAALGGSGYCLIKWYE